MNINSIQQTPLAEQLTLQLTSVFLSLKMEHEHYCNVICMQRVVLSSLSLLLDWLITGIHYSFATALVSLVSTASLHTPSNKWHHN